MDRVYGLGFGVSSHETLDGYGATPWRCCIKRDASCRCFSLTLSFSSRLSLLGCAQGGEGAQDS